MIGRRAIARIRGGVAAARGMGLDDCPYAEAGAALAWVSGFCAAIVSRQAQDPAVPRVAHVKHRAPRNRALWQLGEIHTIEIGRAAGLAYDEIGALLGRTGLAVRIQASRVGLGRDAA